MVTAITWNSRSPQGSRRASKLGLSFKTCEAEEILTFRAPTCCPDVA